MSDNPRIGVAGLGAIGQLHLRTWQGLGAEIVAVADVSESTLEATVAATGAQGFSSALVMLDAAAIDILSICTPPAFHAEVAVAAAERGIVTLCEKPLAATVADAERIAEAVQTHNAMVHVGFCHRFEAAVVTMRQQIAAGEIGTLISIHNRFAGVMVDPQTTWFANPRISGGGALADTAIHSIDLFRYLAGDPVTEVRSLTATQASNLGPALTVEDTGTILLQTESGVIGVLEASWRTPPGVWTEVVYGTAGSFQYDYATQELTNRDAGGAVTRTSFAGQNRFADEFAHVIASWRHGEQPKATAADGVEAQRILAAAYLDAADRS